MARNDLLLVDSLVEKAIPLLIAWRVMLIGVLLGEWTQVVGSWAIL